MSSSRRGTGNRTRFRTGFGTRSACRLPRVASRRPMRLAEPDPPRQPSPVCHQMAAGSHPTHHAGRIGTGNRSRFPRPGGTVIREGLALVEPLVLASRSPQRRAILTQLGVRFEVVEPAYEEVDPPGAAPEQLVVERTPGARPARWMVRDDGCWASTPRSRSTAAAWPSRPTRRRRRRCCARCPAASTSSTRACACAAAQPRSFGWHPRASGSGTSSSQISRLVPGLGGVARAGRRLCRPGPRRRVRGRDRRRPLERRRAARDRAGGSARPGSRGGWLIVAFAAIAAEKQGADDRDSQLIDRVRWP